MSLNYVSSLGSLVSVIGVFVFFYLLWDVCFINSLFIQVNNNFYIICLNKFFISNNIGSFNISKNIYVFYKYNFFNNFISDSLYIYLDRFYISLVIKDLINIAFFNKIIKSYLNNKNINKNIFYLSKFKYLNILLLNNFNFIFWGYFSIIIYLCYLSKNLWYFFIKLYYYNIILRFLSQNYLYYILSFIIKIQKLCILITKI